MSAAVQAAARAEAADAPVRACDACPGLYHGVPVLSLTPAWVCSYLAQLQRPSV